MKPFDYTKMTDQEVFDVVREHLLSQGCPSMDIAGTSCLYRGVDDKMCAAGIFLSDDDAEDVDAINVSWEAVVSHLELDPIHINLISDLQSVHDNMSAFDTNDSSVFKELVESGLKRLATKYNLIWVGD